MRPNVDIIKKVLSLISVNPKIKQRTSFGKPGNRKSKKQITAPVLVEMKLNLSRMSFLTNLSIKGLPKISAIPREGREDLRNHFSKPFWGRPIVWAGVLLR